VTILTRWVFEDVYTLETWTFLHNPFEMQTPTASRRTQPFQRGLGYRGGAIPFPWSFKGRVYTKEEFDILLDWSTRQRIRITDHLGRIHLVTPQGLDPTPRRTRANSHWRYLYTFNALYLGRET
jgi:hypothetical protein